MSKSGSFVYTDAVAVTTKDVASTNIKVSYGSATISYNGYFEVYLDGYRYAEGKQDGNSTKWTVSFKDQVTIKGLDPGKTYHYCISVNGAKGKEVSFTTKSLDLSGTTVQAKETTILDSKVHGTWDFTITSNLASLLPNNKIRFGATNALLYDYVEEYKESFVEYLAGNEAYSSSTKSPYRVSHPWSIGAHSENALDDLGILEEIKDREEKGIADEDDLKIYDIAAYRIIGQALIWPVRAFVEIDGERVYIGKSFDEKY